jgi:uncharacterized protein (DUF2062 family)
MEQRFFQRKVINPLITLLKQGITAERLAFSMALGITIGSFPILGTTTFICTAIALAFRLNFPVIQIGNWLAYPLQIVLIVPFMLMGEYLFGAGSADITPVAIKLSLADLPNWLRLMSNTALHGIIIWSFIAPALVLSLYLLFLPLFRKWKVLVKGQIHA